MSRSKWLFSRMPLLRDCICKCPLFGSLPLVWWSWCWAAAWQWIRWERGMLSWKAAGEVEELKFQWLEWLRFWNFFGNILLVPLLSSTPPLKVYKSPKWGSVLVMDFLGGLGLGIHQQQFCNLVEFIIVVVKTLCLDFCFKRERLRE